jgi:hypothetical protein
VRNLNGSLTVTNQPKPEEDEIIPEAVSEKINHKSVDHHDAHRQGLKNLAFIKSMVREAVAKDEQNRPSIKFVEEKDEVVVKPKSFLEVQREKRMQKNKGSTVFVKENHSTDVTANNATANEEIGAVKANAEFMD